MKVSLSGPCVACKTHIFYGSLNQRHRERGDPWLQRIRDDWEKPLSIGYYHGHPLFNNSGITTLRPYVCDACYKVLRALRDAFREDEASGHTTFPFGVRASG